MTIYHNHHIIPKHAGGTDDEENLVRLTVEEHAEAHRMLYKKYNRWQDKVAWQSLSGLITKAEATIIAIKAANTGRKLSPEHIAKRTKSQTGLKRSKETCRKISEGKKNPPLETRKKLSEANKNNKNGRNKQQWELTDPTGIIYTVNDIFQFCKDNHLHRDCIRKVALGIENRRHHKGWTVKILDTKENNQLST